MNESRPSPWWDESAERSAPLSGEIDVDVAIVGGGYTGLSTAIELRRAGVSVAVLEREHAGFGASGRNAGHLTPTIGKDLPTLVTLFGRERSRELIALVEAAVTHVEETISLHGIDCAYDPVGNVLAAVSERQFAMVDRAARAARDLGADGELLEPEDMRARGLPAAFLRGWLERRGGILDPGRYVRGLRRIVLEEGAAIFEETGVRHVEDHRLPLVLFTGSGRVRASAVVLATNAWTPALGKLRATVLPVHVQLFRTVPLTSEERGRIGWPGREGIYTAHEVLESWRLTADGRILGGSKHVRYGYGGAMLPDVDAAVRRKIERAFFHRFPELGAVDLADWWGGPIAFALDFLPVVGRTGPRGNVYYAAGYAGHGIALASYAGRLLADLMLGDGRALAPLRRPWVPLPPEPLRLLVFRALNGFFEAVDRRTDRATGLV